MSSAPATILPDPQHLRLLGLAGDAEGIVATVAAIAPTSVCPQCGQPSQRIHSRYVRHVFDLPWHGVAFRLDLHVRRFFCDHATCSQRIHPASSRSGGLLGPHHAGLADVLHQVAVAVGGAAGRRLLTSLGVPGLRRSAGVSRDTLLRLIRGLQCPRHHRCGSSGLTTFRWAGSIAGVARSWSTSSGTGSWIFWARAPPQQRRPGCARIPRSLS